MSRYQAVVFDYGNVLAMVDRPAMCAAMARHSPLSAGEVQSLVWGGDLEREAETGAYDSREQFRRVKERIRGEDSWSYEQFREEFAAGFVFNDEGLEALRLAAGRGRRTFILSNTSFLHARLLFQNETLATVPEGYVLSFKVGVMKPDPAIWRHLLRTAGLQAGECLYIDDVPEYCAAAQRLGFTALNYLRGNTDLLQKLENLL